MRDRHPNREIGVEFGVASGKIDDHEYPATTEEVLAAYGDETLVIADGEETVRDLIAPLGDQQYDSAEEVRQAIFTMVGDGAIGRKYYSDRTPPDLGEDREDTPVSF